MREKEGKPEISYWEQNPQFKLRMHETIKSAYAANDPMLNRIIDLFGDFPRVRIEMADRKGIFSGMSQRYIGVMMDTYFSEPLLTRAEIAGRYGLKSPERLTQIKNTIKARLAIVRHRNLHYLDEEFMPLYFEEQWDEAMRVREADRGNVQRRLKEEQQRTRDQELIVLRAENVPYEEISATMGLSVEYLQSRAQTLRKKGAEVPVHRHRPRRKEELAAFDEKVRIFYNAGLRFKEIAGWLKVPEWKIVGSTRRLAMAGKITRRYPRS